jgi:endogenous inhibitor of DNA gyrase (YacG/DUF329 family)
LNDRSLPVVSRERVRCPLCSREFEVELDAPRKERPFFPFCSERCRAIDLGRWVDEEYRVSEPLLPKPEDEESK